MKLPKQNAEQSMIFSGPQGRHGLPSQPLHGAVQMEGFFGDVWGGIKKVASSVGGCAIKCGPQALSCVHCGGNKACWASCAGPSIAGCIAENCL